MTDHLIPAEVVEQACGHLYGSDHPHPFSRHIDDLRRDGVRRALEAALPALTTTVASDHAAAGRAIGCYLGVDSASLAADARALVERCTLAEFERDRLEQDAHEWLRVVSRVEAERDVLAQRIQHAREILTRAAAGCCADTVHHIGEAERVLGGVE